MLNKVIYIGGVARSGTSWIGQIFNSSPIVNFKFQPLFSYEFRDKVNEESSSYESFFNELYRNNSDFLIQKDKMDKKVYPTFFKNKESILVFKENRFQSFIEPMLRKSKELIFVGVIRNPNATLYSWSQNEKEFPKGSDIMKEWRFANCKNKGNEDYFGYYKWKEVSNLYLDLKQKFGERVQILHYDELLNDTENKIKLLFNKLDIPFTKQTKDFLTSSGAGNDNNYYSVFKGRTNKQLWKDEFPKYIQEQIEADLKGTRLEKYLF